MSLINVHLLLGLWNHALRRHEYQEDDQGPDRKEGWLFEKQKNISRGEGVNMGNT